VLSAKPRVAVALAPVTQSEFVALVAALESLGAVARFELVVPSLDVMDTTARVRALLANPRVVEVEPVHEYLRRGHDRVVLAGDDPGVRGRSMASLLAGSDGSDRHDPAPMTPPAVVAWLATAWSPMVPEPLQKDDVRQPANDGAQLVPDYTDPAAVRFVQRWVRTGDVAVEIAPRTGALTVHMARATGPRGHVVAIAAAADSERLRACFALNGVTGWTEIITTHEDADIERALTKLDVIDVLCIDESDFDVSRLDAVTSTLLDGRVRKLLARIPPPSLSPATDALHELLVALRDRAGASFGVVSWDGRVTPAVLSELLATDDFVLVAVDMVTPG
jgi:hypothetical protein